MRNRKSHFVCNSTYGAGTYGEYVQPPQQVFGEYVPAVQYVPAPPQDVVPQHRLRGHYEGAPTPRPEKKRRVLVRNPKAEDFEAWLDEIERLSTKKKW